MNTIIDSISRRIEGHAGSAGINWTRLLLAGGGAALLVWLLRGLWRASWSVFGIAMMFFWVWRFAL